jgi:hypothetical protein
MPWSNSRPRSRKYGHAHAADRKTWAARHQSTDLCGWCGHVLGPMRPGLHLAHDPTGTVVLGFWHGSRCSTCGVRCNLQEAAKRARARQNVIRMRL